MPRIARDTRLETRDARSKLPQRHQPYWRTIHPGLAIGYRKGTRGGVWQVRYLRGTDYRFGTIGTADDHGDADGLAVLSYKQATRLALDYAEQHDNPAEPETKPVAGHYTVGQAMTAYLKRMKLEGKSHSHTQRVVDAHILPAFQDRPAEALTHTEIKRWLDQLATAPARIRGKKKTREVDPDNSEAMRKRKATANRILTVLKAALNHAYEHGRVKSADAWRRVKPFRNVDAPKVRHLSQDECIRLMNTCGEDLRALVRGALLTGCRFGELANMQVSDYNPDGGTITVRESKGGKPRHVPLTDEGQKFFERLTAGKKGGELVLSRADGEAWTKNYYTRPLRQACERAEIDPPASFHILRHTYGSLLAARGVPLQVIATAMGHADTRMTERHYAHLMPSYVADMVRANLPSFGTGDSTVRKLKSRSA